MLEELAKLEELQRQTRQRLVEIEVKQRQSNPQLDVVDWASLPDSPIRPDYPLQAAIAGAGCLALALLVVWLRDYLAKEPELATINSVTEFQLYQHASPNWPSSTPQPTSSSTKSNSSGAGTTRNRCRTIPPIPRRHRRINARIRHSFNLSQQGIS